MPPWTTAQAMIKSPACNLQRGLAVLVPVYQLCIASILDVISYKGLIKAA